MKVKEIEGVGLEFCKGWQNIQGRERRKRKKNDTWFQTTSISNTHVAQSRGEHWNLPNIVLEDGIWWLDMSYSLTNTWLFTSNFLKWYLLYVNYNNILKKHPNLQ